MPLDTPGLARAEAELARLQRLNNSAVGARLKATVEVLSIAALYGAKHVRSMHETLPHYVDTRFPVEVARVTGVLQSSPAGSDIWINSIEFLTEHPRFGMASLDARAEVLFRGGVQFRYHYKRTDTRVFIEKAIHYFERCLQLGPEPPELLCNLAMCYGDKFEHSALLHDLDTAASFANRALAKSDGRKDTEDIAMLCLASSLHQRFRVTGDVKHLERARSVLSRSIDSIVSPMSRGSALHELGRILTASFEASGQIDYILRARDCHRESVKLSTPSTQSWITRSVSLANAERECYETSRQVECLDRAIELMRNVLKTPSIDRANEVMAKNNLSGALGKRFERTGSRQDIDESIEGLRWVITHDLERNALKENHQMNLAVSLSLRFQVSDNIEDLHESIGMFRSLRHSPDLNDSSALWRTVNFANALSRRYSKLGNEDDQRDATELYRSASARMQSNSESGKPTYAMMAWAHWASDCERWSEAAEAYDYVLPWMIRRYRRQLTHDQRNETLQALGELAADMSLAYVMAGTPSKAVVAVENARALWLNEALDESPQTVERLSRDSPELAARWWHLRLELKEKRRKDREIQQAEAVTDRAPSSSDSIRLLDLLEDVERQIRNRSGFESFARTLTLEEVQLKADRRPIVYLSITARGAIALVVTPDAIKPIMLHKMKRSEFSERIVRYINAEVNAPQDWSAYLSEVDDFTAWLWVAGVSTLADSTSNYLSLTLVPVGFASHAPWHAAWRPDTTAADGRSYWSDSCLVTYAPNARCLSLSDSAGKLESVLAVTDPINAGPGLRGAVAEVNRITDLFQTKVLSGSEATPENVLDNIENYDVLHLACHGEIDVNEPLDTSIVLTDGRGLRVQDFLERRWSAKRLAVLSACDSAFSGLIADEAMSLPAAMLTAGFEGIIGTLWPVSDRSTEQIMRIFYEILAEGTVAPAQALSMAQVRFRKEFIRTSRRSNTICHPFHWAGFVYVGV